MAAAASFTILFGATTYFFSSKSKNNRRKKVPTSRRDVIDHQALESDEDEFFTQFSRKAQSDNYVPIAFTFEDLYERAILLASQKNQQRNVKLLFDSNDEYVLEEAVPELLNYRARCL